MTIASERLGVLFLAEVINVNDGIATYCQTLASGLQERDVRVYLISGPVKSDARSQGRRDALAASFEDWQVLPGMKKFPSLGLIRKVVRFVKEHDIGAINTHGLGMLLLGRAVAALTGVRFVGTYHPSLIGGLSAVKQTGDNRFSRSQEIFLSLFMPEKLVVLSDQSVDFIRQHRIPHKERVVKIMAGTRLDHFHPPSAAERAAARAQLGLAPDDYVCVIVARLSWNKGHDLLIQAVRMLCAADPALPIRCLIVGSGAADRETEIKAFAHGGDAADEQIFRFVGFIPDARTALWASDVYVLPSRFEGFAIGVVEAMAVGLVPVRTPAGGATDQIVEGETGFIVPFEDADALAEAIGQLADPQVRGEMAARNAERAKRLFGIDPMIDAILPLYGLPARAAV